MSATDDQYLADDSMDPSDADSPVSSAPATGTSSPLFKSDPELSAKAAGKRTATAMLGVEYPNEGSRHRRSRVYDDDETPGGDDEEDDLPRRRYKGSSSTAAEADGESVDEDEELENDLAGLDTRDIIWTGGRTRGKVIDFTAAALEDGLSDDDDDDDDDDDAGAAVEEEGEDGDDGDDDDEDEEEVVENGEGESKVGGEEVEEEGGVEADADADADINDEQVEGQGAEEKLEEKEDVDRGEALEVKRGDVVDEEEDKVGEEEDEVDEEDSEDE